MYARMKLAVCVAVCLLTFGLWLVFVWLPPEALIHRSDLLLWLVSQILVTLALLWWIFGATVNEPLLGLVNFLRGVVPKVEAVSANEPIKEIIQRVKALGQRLANNEASLARELQARRAAETELHETQERYALAVRGSDDGLWEWNIDTGAMYLSPRWEAMLGFGNNELDDEIESWKSRIHGDDRGAVERGLLEHLSGATTRFESEHRLKHKNGDERWVLSRGAALRHASGRAYRMIGLDSDITAYKRIEAILQHVAAGAANALGTEFYRMLVMHFAQALDVAEAFVTECVDRPPTRVRTLACWERGRFITDEYDLAPTPCKIVFETKERYFVPHDLGRHFPNELSYGYVSYLGIPKQLADRWPLERAFNRDSYLGLPLLDRIDGRVIGHLACCDSMPMSEQPPQAELLALFTRRGEEEVLRHMGR